MAAHTTVPKQALCGSVASLPARCAQKAASRSVAVHAEPEEASSRRTLLSLVAGGAALLANAGPSEAAFGDSANVFGKATNTTGFIPYSGEGWSLLLPSKWNPSREREYKGIELRYEDNGDAVNNVVVISRKTEKGSVRDFGSVDEFLTANSYLFGEQTFKGNTSSEGGFKKNKTSAASILDVQQGQDKKGKDYYKYELLVRSARPGQDKKGKHYYKYELLVRSADGDEGGRHQLVTASVGSGNLYILKVQIGDKRWFKGAKNAALGIQNSFNVA